MIKKYRNLVIQDFLDLALNLILKFKIIVINNNSNSTKLLIKNYKRIHSNFKSNYQPNFEIMLWSKCNNKMCLINL